MRDWSELSDDELVEATRKGRPEAFGALHDRHRRLVFCVLLRSTRGDADTARDLSQEIFLKAFEKLSSFRGDAPFRAWLMSITHHVATDWANRRVTEWLKDELVASGAPGPDEEAMVRLQRGMLREHVKQYLATLSPELLMLYELVAVVRLTHLQTAEILGMSHAACRMAYSRMCREIVDTFPRGPRKP
ncbi:MAG: sigma-70 family RNA polymerase sigma factor [Candidatus Riflebacteria bacterium]|nr:sigma-70 family RNA polymerase sigma factor [Candidatus Riflebacteria bacterium]